MSDSQKIIYDITNTLAVARDVLGEYSVDRNSPAHVLAGLEIVGMLASDLRRKSTDEYIKGSSTSDLCNFVMRRLFDDALSGVNNVDAVVQNFRKEFLANKILQERAEAELKFGGPVKVPESLTNPTPDPNQVYQEGKVQDRSADIESVVSELKNVTANVEKFVAETANLKSPFQP